MSSDPLVLRFVFALPILLIGGVSALHATGYLHGDARKRQGWFWLYFVGTLVSMASVVAAWSPLSFLVAWEAMGLFSAGLVGFESATKESKRATYIYLLACQAGALALMCGWIYGLWALIFIGFALKIGFPPFHVWLPEAHPAAPAPASAVMSGAMIPLGFYGILNFTNLVSWARGQELFPGNPSVGCWTFLVFGVVAALGGILLALPQRNLKKLLAFSSVENMGVIALGLAMSVFGAMKDLDVVLYASVGALLHVLNHALLKGALFLCAGSVLRMTGTLDIDRLGGLMKKMPHTGTLFAVNALGLSGLPPLNGFMSELCIYVAAFKALKYPELVLPASVVIITLALTGGIATAVYTKAVSATFLGEAREDQSDVRETPRRMLVAIETLTLLSCILSGTVLFLIPVGLLLLVRKLLPRGKEHPRQLTWDCGYEKPTARMAWTGTAFSQPLADTFRGLLRPREHVVEKFDGLLPVESAVAVETDDPGISRLFYPIFHSLARTFQRWHLLQNGSLHFYVLLMILAIVALLIWGAFA